MSRPTFSPTIHADLMAAIDRLVARGHDVSFASVAREADHARGTISRKDSSYVVVRDRIIDLQRGRRRLRPDGPSAIDRDRRVSDLQSDVVRLSAQVTSLQSALVSVLLTVDVTIEKGNPQKIDLERRRAARLERMTAETAS